MDRRVVLNVQHFTQGGPLEGAKKTNEAKETEQQTTPKKGEQAKERTYKTNQTIVED